MRRSKARFVLGLSATVARKDGHQPIIFMQCGPVRYRVDAKAQAERRGFEHRVQVRATDFQLPTQLQGQERVPMPELYAALAADEARNTLIFDDVLAALEAGRCPLVLTERRDHLEALRARFEKFAKNIVVLRGGMGTRERRAAEEASSCAGARGKAGVVDRTLSWGGVRRFSPGYVVPGFADFLEGNAWLSTWGGSIGSIRAKERCVCTTTWMRMFRCLRVWRRKGGLDTRRSAIRLNRGSSGRIR